MRKVIVVGGGASGLMSAIWSAKCGNEVILLESNEKLGKKIYITGKGRCNLSNYSDVQDFIKNVVSNPKFLFSSLNSFSPHDTYNFFEESGLKLKVERGNRVFPASDKASDVTKTLEKLLNFYNVKVMLNTKVLSIIEEKGVAKGVKTESEVIKSDSVIVCTGGISYSSTGSTGDGYSFAKNLGHNVVSLVPSLVGLELKGGDYSSLQGLSLKNVSLSCSLDGSIIHNSFGELLFTHFGVSGPLILTLSSLINRKELNNCYISIDLKPALDEKTLNDRILRDFSENLSKSIINVIPKLVPKSMSEVVLSRSKIRFDKKCCEITKEERERLIYTLKNFTFFVRALRPIEEAVVTAGGVDVKEVNPKTMESKIVKNLFFAGEVLDVDAFTGGYNLQIAFSTGYIAGNNS